MEFWQENKNTIKYHGLPAVIVLTIISISLDYSSFENFSNSLFLTDPLLLISLIIFGKKFLNLCWAIIKQITQILEQCGTKARLVACVGPPGAGKTVLAGYNINILSKRLWRELEYKYFIAQSLYSKNLYQHNNKALQDFQELQASYNFYKKRPLAIKCIVSNLPISKDINGKQCFSSKLEIEHIKQIKKLPSWTVIFEDEVDLEQGSNTSRCIEPIIQATYKLPRHLGEWFIYLTAQNPNKLGDFIRGCLDYMIYCQGQEWYLKPNLLLLIYNNKKSRFIKRCRNYKFDENTALKLLKFNSYLMSIGYRKIKYKRISNCELNTEKDALKGRRSAYYLPSVPITKYSDRAWRDTYKCKDDFIFCETFKKLYLDANDLKFQIYNEQKTEKEQRKKNERGKKKTTKY